MADGDKANSTNDTKAKAKGGADAAPTQYQFAQKPEEKPGWEGFKQFLWNSEKREFLGRTGCSWFKIGIFYLIYYTLLTLYFLVMLYIFYQTLDDKAPKWQTSSSIIGENPGLGYRPMPSSDRVESTLIKYIHGEYAEDYKPWVSRLDDFVQNYTALMGTTKPGKADSNRVDCDFNLPKPNEPQFCKINVQDMFQGPCTKASNYSFPDGSPCILLKLNRIYGWEPKPYENSTLPDEAPDHLKEYVKSKETHDMMGKMVWMSCEGENPADKDNIGEIEYMPYPGIPTYYFPYKNQDGYLSPAIFAHFKNPKKGVLISISCKAWAHNIQHDQMERKGTAHFELMID